MRLAPQASHLSSAGHQLLMKTCYGPLDLLDTIGRGHGHEDLLPSTTLVDAGQGVQLLRQRTSQS